MELSTQSVLQEQLIFRRQRLQSAIAATPEPANLVRLIQEVDSALERMESGTYGLCVVCHDPVEEDRLMADPLLQNCLDHLTPDQQRALQQDLDLASQIQGALLPRPNLTLPGWEVYRHYEAAGSVSGDYCDLLTRDGADGDCLFLTGDVSGKGVAASILMAQLHAIFRSLTTDAIPLDQLVERANRLFCGSTMSTHYATLVCGRAARSGELQICNAGHCPPLVIQGDRVFRLEATGLPVGLFSSSQYSVRTLHMAPGETVFLYTDGLTEALNRSNVEYGEQRVTDLVHQYRALSAPDLARVVIADLSQHLSGGRKTDDLTIMVLRRTA